MQKLPEKLYLAKQVREMDRIVIEEKGFSGIDLMRKAGQALLEIIQKQDAIRQVTVFCGAGNNAGDGYIVAGLALESRYQVKVYSLSKPENLTGDAYLAYQEYIERGAKVSHFDNTIDLSNNIVIDALLGTGLNREISGGYAEAIKFINNSSCTVISADIPSGLNADTGRLMGCAVKADVTVSFIALKRGMFTGDAAEYCGEIIFSSLEIASDVIEQVSHTSKLLNHCSLAKRHRCAHKGMNGHVLLIGGDAGYSGAIRLASEAALRVGAGLVSVATHKSHSGYINHGRPELMCHGIDSVDELIPLLNKATVVVIGPGLGQGLWGKALFKAIVNIDKPLIIDADALGLLAKEKSLHNHWVLTPHPGEAARLLSCSTADIAQDRFATVSALQQQYGGVVVLKGAGTLIDIGNEISISPTGNPGMASGGMGDVLAGMIGGLVAQKNTLESAAKMAVYLHGKAADLAVEQDGEIGLLASDLMPFIRSLVNR